MKSPANRERKGEAENFNADSIPGEEPLQPVVLATCMPREVAAWLLCPFRISDKCGDRCCKTTHCMAWRSVNDEGDGFCRLIEGGSL
jgi:hypothetical protein